jgi:hypothetical protein
MECNLLKDKPNRKKRGLLVIIGLIILIPFIWVLLVRFEGQDPEIVFDLPSPYVPKSHEFSVSFSDTKSGLRKVWVAMIKDGKEVVLVDTDFAVVGKVSGGQVKTHTLKIPFEPAKYQFSDGEAILRLAVWDNSWRGWWKGNRVYVEKNLVIDTVPPEIEMLSTVHNLTQGGSGLVIFRASEDAQRSGVQVGDNFFPAHGGYYKDKRIRLAYVGLGYQQGKDTRIFIRASDEAGNSTQAGINYYIRKKAFKKDRIRISDRF